MLLSFVLTPKSCLEAAIASHRHIHISSLNYISLRVAMAKWVLDINPQSVSKLIKFAAYDGALDVLIYLQTKEPSILWNTNLCSSAAEHGHLNVMVWLQSQHPPCPWDEKTCTNAAWNGYLHVLQWLSSQNPPLYTKLNRSPFLRPSSSSLPRHRSVYTDGSFTIDALDVGFVTSGEI